MNRLPGQDRSPAAARAALPDRLPWAAAALVIALMAAGLWSLVIGLLRAIIG
ncbi:hypothetical protein [Paracraurococcus lichenis]|uniref:DUF2474 family protein n=1 Tax=Paracraurococcus lichenis TaxID=3064888 RepID=A0ABT9EB12_9PROT|nr:hypothetical protein [Paracraurococcus sp. LOR1-02]MDO9713100.1 hypothetical protein [Paracraurococcus sp. LOR1-02]